MAFRRNEEIEKGFEAAARYLIPKKSTPEEQQELKDYLDHLTTRLGPVVDRYPSWHPLVCNHNETSPITHPSNECGYRRLDHTVYFANGFLSCPYRRDNGQKIIDSVNELWKGEAYKRYSHVANIEAERIDKPFYFDETDPILVVCNWLKPMPNDNTIPKNIAIGLMLENAVPCWRTSECGETWETMRPYLMGEPCGKRSSMFLDQEAGQAMKKVYEAITYSGMFGNLKV
ncbi:MAG: hypothetical protein V7717_11835 [Porticoccaceae bacterium]